MESNYIKSARAKLKKLGVTSYEDFNLHKPEIFNILFKTIELELTRKLNNSLLQPDYKTVVGATSYPDPLPERKPWGMQTLEYYTERKTYERPKQTLPLL